MSLVCSATIAGWGGDMLGEHGRWRSLAPARVAHRSSRAEAPEDVEKTLAPWRRCLSRGILYPRGQKLLFRTRQRCNAARSAGHAGLRTRKRNCRSDIGCGRAVDINCSNEAGCVHFIRTVWRFVGRAEIYVATQGGRVNDSLSRRRVRTIALAVSYCARHAGKRMVGHRIGDAARLSSLTRRSLGAAAAMSGLTGLLYGGTGPTARPLPGSTWPSARRPYRDPAPRGCGSLI